MVGADAIQTLLWLYVDMGAFAVYIIEICQGDSIHADRKNMSF